MQLWFCPILAFLLGSGRSSRFYQELREKRGIAHWVWAGTWGAQECGLFAAEAVDAALGGLAHRVAAGEDEVGAEQALRLFVDGALGADTALLREKDGSVHGIRIHPQEELDAMVARTHRAGLRVEAHAIGDAAAAAAWLACHARK
jgi:predicted amidohydrolase YtcJ